LFGILAKKSKNYSNYIDVQNMMFITCKASKMVEIKLNFFY